MTALAKLLRFDVPKLKLIPVRGDGATVHYASANAKGGIDHAPALCGLEGPLDRFARPRWRRVSEPGDRTCMTCHANACARPTTIVWR